jgi:hypothetical protein
MQDAYSVKLTKFYGPNDIASLLLKPVRPMIYA